MKKIILLFLISFAFVGKAQNPGDVAQNFGTAYGFNFIVYSIVLQTDGKILVGGSFTNYNPTIANLL